MRGKERRREKRRGEELMGGKEQRNIKDGLLYRKNVYMIFQIKKVRLFNIIVGKFIFIYQLLSCEIKRIVF